MIENILFGLAFAVLLVFSACIRFIRWILKGLVALVVVVGALVSLSGNAASVEFLLDRWWQVGILAIFLYGVAIRRRLLVLERDLANLKMCAVATCSYLDIEPETEDVEESRKLGEWEWMKRRLLRDLGDIFLPFPRGVDRLLFTHAVRNGMRIKLGDDLRKLAAR